MRKAKPPKKAVKPTSQRESAITGKTAGRHKLWIDLGVATTNAVSVGVPRVVVIEDLLRVANNLAGICEENGDDMSALGGLL
jgi:hypothetical protein